MQLLPIIRLQLAILDPLLRPLLVPPADAVLAGLEVPELVVDAFFDEDAAGVLGYYAFLVLLRVSVVPIER